MRILFVSNFFPPVVSGGYEQWCEDVALALAARGHTMCILTSRIHSGSAVPATDAHQPYAIHRLLHQEVAGGLGATVVRLLGSNERVHAEDLRHTQELIETFRPDAALIWGMWNIARSIPLSIERLLGRQVAYYLCDYWPTLPSAYVQRLQAPARRVQMQQFKSLVSSYFLPRLMQADSVPLRLENPICVSRAVRDILVAHGVDVAHAKVVYGGTSIEEFDAMPQRRAAGDLPLRLLYIGRLQRIKGLHTVVKAMQLLDDTVTLDVLGAGDPEYVAELEGAVLQTGLQERVRFLGAAQRSQVPYVLAQHDVLLFPSEWDEPFARSVLEAMAAGLVVIGTTTGGTGEVLVDGETGLTYPAGDAERLAEQIRRLVDDAILRRRLAESGCRTVRQNFTLGRMVDELEAKLCTVANKPLPISC
jgi:glycosyltransferase involved in cell wall biosynthesis